jgi:hypothetical protein
MKIYLFIVLILSGIASAQVELDQTILHETDELSTDPLFRNIIAVQRKVLERKKRISFGSGFAFNYSDTPKSMHHLNFNLSYGLSEIFEIGATVSPIYLSSKRSVLENSSIQFNSPKMELGAFVNYYFLFGKDSFGPLTTFRSDTFGVFEFSQIQYAESKSGTKLTIGIGKNYYLKKGLNLNLRFAHSMFSYFLNDEEKNSSSFEFRPSLIYIF